MLSPGAAARVRVTEPMRGDCHGCCSGTALRTDLKKYHVFAYLTLIRLDELTFPQYRYYVYAFQLEMPVVYDLQVCASVSDATTNHRKVLGKSVMVASVCIPIAQPADK